MTIASTVCSECESEFKINVLYSMIQPSFCPFCGSDAEYNETLSDDLIPVDENNWD